MRDLLESRILAEIPNTEVNGHPHSRLANTANIAFHGVESDGLLAFLDQAGVCASKGSACLGNSDGPSHVIKAMKPKGLVSRQSLRFSLGFQTTRADVDACLTALKQGVALLRA
jgi:cysteine desulfurase